MYTNNFTPKVNDTIQIEKMLTDLVPGFLKNKFDDVKSINGFFEKKDFTNIKRIAHNWKGACPSYGFNYLGEVGKQFETLIQQKDYETLKDLIQTLPPYLKNINIEYTES